MANTPGTVLFPTNLDDADSLIRAVNNIVGTTTTDTGGTGANSVGGTTIAVVSTTGYPATGIITIDNEIIAYTALTSTTFTGCVRGLESTTAAAHTLGAKVYHFATALHHSAVRDAVIAAETKIGTGASTPTAANTYLRGTGTGTTAWGPITVADLNATLAATTALLSLLGNAAGTSVFKVANKASSSVDMATFDASATTNGVIVHIDANGHLGLTQALPPTAVAGVGAGNGAGTTPTLTVSGTDQSGTLQVVTGTQVPVATGVIATVTFRNVFATAPKGFALYPMNADTAGLAGVYLNSLSASSWIIIAGSTGLVASKTYLWSYLIL